MADTLRESLEKRRKALDNPETSEMTATRGSKPKKKAPAKKKHTESRGVGRDHAEENRKRLVGELRSRIEKARAAGNKNLVTELEGRIKALNNM